MITEKRTLALYRCTDTRTECIVALTHSPHLGPGYLQISEPVEIIFPMLPEPSREERLAQIRSELEAANKAHIDKTNALKRQHAELAGAQS